MGSKVEEGQIHGPESVVHARDCAKEVNDHMEGERQEGGGGGCLWSKEALRQSLRQSLKRIIAKSSKGPLGRSVAGKLKPIDINERLSRLPMMRGKIHLVLVYAAPIWANALLRRCQSGRALIATWIAILCALINFGCSAILHNVRWSTYATRTFWRRVDHCGIFLMISGSCAPVPLLLFSPGMSALWAILQWGSTLVGVLLCLCYDPFSISDHYGTRAMVYAFVGLSNVAFTLEFRRVLNRQENLYLTLMAVSYVVGAVFYGCKWPKLCCPKIAGYHEVFHFMCLLAATFTFMLNYLVLSRAPPS